MTQHPRDRHRVAPGELRGDVHRPTTDALVRSLEIAMHVADAASAGVTRLPDLPAMTAMVVPHDEPVMRGDMMQHTR